MIAEDPNVLFVSAATPGIAPTNQQQPGTTMNPYSSVFEQAFQWLAGISAMAGARVGGAGKAGQERAGTEASKAPFKAAEEQAQRHLGVAGLGEVGVYVLLALLLLLGVWGLLSAAGGR